MINFSAISWHEQVTFDEMIMMSVLYKIDTAYLDFYRASSLI
jgi:hypothetical protein